MCASYLLGTKLLLSCTGRVPSGFEEPSAHLVSAPPPPPQVGLVAWSVFRVIPKHAQRDPYVYLFSLFGFTCAVDLLIAFCVDKYTTVLRWYLEEGERYLDTAHGAAINYWDGAYGPRRAHNALWRRSL